MTARFRDSLRHLATTCLALTIALAAVSHLRGSLVGLVRPAHTVYVRSEFGKLVVHAQRTDPCEWQGWRTTTWPHAPPALAPSIGGWWRYGGFGYARAGTTIGLKVHQLAIPYWPLAVLGIAMCVAIWTWNPRRVPSQ